MKSFVRLSLNAANGLEITLSVTQKKNQCTCKENFHWIGGKCSRFVDFGEQCEENVISCYNGYDLEALTCNNGICICSESFYERSGMDCRRKNVKDVLDCAIDLDCAEETDTCKIGKCSAENKKSVSTTLLEDDAVDEKTELSECFTDSDCENEKAKNTVCSESNKCVCRENYIMDNNVCVEGPKRCSSEADCSSFANSICFHDICVCEQGYFNKNGVCEPEIGLKFGCKSDQDCPIKPSKCTSGVCYCKNHWFTDEKKQNCLKTSIKDNLNCLSNEWCYVYGPNSFCNFDGDNPTGTCSCSSNSELSSDYYCKPNDAPKPECLTDNQCGRNKVCRNEECVCNDDYYFLENGECVLFLGAPCNLEEVCTIQDSNCLEGTCTCDDNYTTDDNMVCLSYAHYNETCQKDVQCAVVLDNAVCQNNTCQCNDDYTYVESKCHLKKNYGSVCQTKTECTIVLDDSFVCRNSICQCPIGISLKESTCSSANLLMITVTLFLLLVIPMHVV